jgi:periplasmic protein TonB
MPRDLFGDVARPSVSIGNRKWYTVPLSLLSHSIAVGALVVVPLMATDVLPPPWESMKIEYITIRPAPPPPPAPPPAGHVPPPPSADNRDAAPIDAPEGITAETPRPEAGFENAVGVGVILGDPDSRVIAAPPLPPPDPKPVRVGGLVRQPQKTRDVQPVYPPMAQAARVQGIVIIEATLGADGRVMNARVLRSVPLLDNAALDAVRQWEFTPTLLNGVPVPVVMTITVQFVLSK